MRALTALVLLTPVLLTACGHDRTVVVNPEPAKTTVVTPPPSNTVVVPQP